jgi:hypothetical protein
MTNNKKSALRSAVVLFASSGLLGTGVLLATPASAGPGSLSTPFVTINWDDSNWYLPAGGCSRYRVDYTTGDANGISKVALVNAFGDEAGFMYAMNRNSSGSDTIQLCSPDDKGKDVPFTLRLYARQTFTRGDGSSQILEAPVTIRTRQQTPTKNTDDLGDSENRTKSIKCLNEKSLNAGTYKTKKFKGKWAKQGTCPTGWRKT